MINHVRSGIIDVLSVRNPYSMAETEAWYALAAAHDVVSPKYADMEVSVITKDNPATAPPCLPSARSGGN